MRKVFSLLFFTSVFLPLAAKISVTRYFGNEDLTCNLITEICQDSDGFIWVGTLNGLNIYDGWTFRHIYSQAGDTTSLLSNYIHELYSDSKGRLWVGTNLGLQRYDGLTGKFRSVRFPEGRTTSVDHITELADGELWIVNGNISRIDPDLMTAEPAESINKLTGSSVTEVFTDSTGAVWLASNRNRVFRMRGDSLQTIETESSLLSFLESGGAVYASSRTDVYRWNELLASFEKLENDCEQYTRARMLKSQDGNIYMATNGQGFRVVDTQGMKVLPTGKFVCREVDLDHISTLNWIEDRSGNIWIGSAFNGLVMVSNHTVDFMSIRSPGFSVPYNDMVNTVYCTRDGKLWSGTETGKLYMHLEDLLMDEVQTFPGSIYSLHELDDRYLLVGTKLHGLYKFDRRTKAYRIVDGTQGLYIKKMFKCPDGSLVFSLFSQGITFYDTKSETMGGNIRAGTVNTLLYDKDGLIWCGTYGGVKCYRYEDRTEQSLRDNIELDAAVVYSLYESTDRKIWIGSSDGLFSYDKATETCTHYRNRHLENNVICGLAGDNEGNIWASTFNGVVRFNPGDDSTCFFPSGHGLFDTEYIRGSYWQEPERGMIFFGGQHEVTAFDPSKKNIQPFGVPPVLTGMHLGGVAATSGTLSGKRKISDTPFVQATELNLAHCDNSPALLFSSMDFRQTENITTEYALDSEESWASSQTGSNQVLLSNLKPGKHILRVRFNDNGAISPVKTLSIAVRPPWYADWKAFIAYALAAAVIFFAAWQAAGAARKKAARAKSDKARLEFLSHLTHELRTPMTLVTTPLQKLASNSYDEDTDNELKTAQQNAEKVVSLLDKTLDAGMIEGDDSKLKFSEVDLVGHMADLLAGFEYQASLCGVALTFRHDCDSLPVWTERSRFDKVITTLAGNALKSTPAGGAVEVAARRTDKAAEIEITADGKGTADGADMDMFLCREIISQLKGSLTASDRPDRTGRILLISIPLGKSHISGHSIVSEESLIQEALRESLYSDDEGRAAQSSVSSRKYSIIAIDGNAGICRYLTRLLGQKFNIATFTSAAEGFNAALMDVPDLIITEMMMPDIDGLAFVKRVKSNANTAHVPVLLLTSLPDESIKLKGLLTGADAIISKPFNGEELTLVCTNLIMSRSRLASHIKDMQITKEILHPVELQGNNDALMQKVITIINEHISDPELNVEMLADSIGISRGHLHRKIKEITGSSPGEYIRAIRLNQAAQLLKGGKKNISQVAYSVGYSNPSVFSTAFKAFFGVSAKEYQKRHAETEGKEQQAG